MPDLTNQQLLDQLLEAIRQEFVTKQYLDERLQNMATKDDLKNDLKTFATKDDLKNDLKTFATKDDIKNDLKTFATKDDIKSVRGDIARLERKLDDHRHISTQHHLKILEEVGHLNRKFTKVSEEQKDLHQMFGRLRIVSE